MDAPTDNARSDAEPAGASYSQERTDTELLADIERGYEEDQRLDRPKRIRGSAIGKECGRELAYDFLWVTPAKAFEGRMLRLFEDGEEAETKLIRHLRSIDLEVLDTDPTNSKKQIWVDFLDGHGGGYLDGLSRDRERNGPWRVVECKTHNDRNFKKLLKDGIELTKPEHAGQFSIYGHALGITKALYISKNKNDSSVAIIYADISESYVKRLLERAELIVGKRVLPPRIGAGPTSHKCKFCDHKAVCHEAAPVDRNCRSCQFSRALPGGTWGCDKHGCTIDKALMVASCDDYEVHDLFRVEPK